MEFDYAKLKTLYEAALERADVIAEVAYQGTRPESLAGKSSSEVTEAFKTKGEYKGLILFAEECNKALFQERLHERYPKQEFQSFFEMKSSDFDRKSKALGVFASQAFEEIKGGQKDERSSVSKASELGLTEGEETALEFLRDAAKDYEKKAEEKEKIEAKDDDPSEKPGN